MAKTEMNESIDKIIHNYRLDQITIEKISRLVNKDYVDNYGNVLHAVLNFIKS